MKTVIVWECEVPYPDKLEEYSTELAGYSCYVAQQEKSDDQKEWSWVIFLILPGGAAHDEELTGGEADTLARAMLESVRELKKITRKIFRDLKTLNGATKVDMKVKEQPQPRRPRQPREETA